MDTPTCDVSRDRFSKRLVSANHTHTWWHVMGPLTRFLFTFGHLLLVSVFQNCSTSTAFRRRRSEGGGGGWSTRVSDAATVSSGPITTRMDTGEEDEDDDDSTQQSKKKVMLGVVIAAGILVTIFLSLVAFITCVVCNSERWFSKPVLYRLE